MSFYNHMKEVAGMDLVLQMKKYSNLKKCLAQQLNRKIYLLKCKKKQATPKFISRILDKILNFGQNLNDETLENWNL